MRDWQSEKEDYLASGHSERSGWCAVAALLFLVAAAWIGVYLLILNQLNR